MVKLTYPTSEKGKYAEWQGRCIGPFGLSEDLDYLTYEYKSPFHMFSQGSHPFWGENDVNHQKIEGELNFDLLSGCATPEPTDGYPLRCKVQFYNRVKSFLHGFGTYSRSYIAPASNGYTYIHCFGMFESSRSALTVAFPTGNPHSIKLVTLVQCASENIDVRYNLASFTNVYTEAKAWKTVEEDVTTMTTDQLFQFGRTHITAFFYRRYTQVDNSELYSLFQPKFSIPLALRIVDRYCLELSQKLPTVDDQVMGDVIMEAIRRTNVTGINVLQFLRDLRHPTSMIPKLANLKSLAGISSNYLAVKYGVLPTISDLKSIYAGFQRLRPILDSFGFQLVRGGITSSSQDGQILTTVSHRAKLALDNREDNFYSLVKATEKFGLDPSLENIWDLIPYSFVVDWFVKVGDFLRRIDSNNRLDRYVIPYVTMSHKVQSTITLLSEPNQYLTGQISLVQYHRWTTDRCPRPALLLQQGSGLDGHWLEGSALVTQRVR